ncbi:hypothetical protein CCP3SC5AM1_720018 [Gammaproteobacteria bacterium]
MNYKIQQLLTMIANDIHVLNSRNGRLDSLLTIYKSNLVGAINELHFSLFNRVSESVDNAIVALRNSIINNVVVNYGILLNLVSFIIEHSLEFNDLSSQVEKTVSFSTIQDLSLVECNIACTNIDISDGEHDFLSDYILSRDGVNNGEPPQLMDQIITFEFEDNKMLLNRTLSLSAFSDSNLPIFYSTLTPNICTVDNNILSAISTGYCSIAADQPGNIDYNAAEQKIRKIMVVPFSSYKSNIADFWRAITVSGNGDVFVLGTNTHIYKSDNFGLSWSVSGDVCDWRCIASSFDGTKLIAGTIDGKIYISLDSGASWQQKAIVRQISGVSISSDGSKLFAIAIGFPVAYSFDAGENWDVFNMDANHLWDVASSSSGELIFAGGQNDFIYVSTDYGNTFEQKGIINNWGPVASSSSGQVLVAISAGDYIYVSTDFGVSWVPRENQREWVGVSISSGGSIITACVFGGMIYRSTDVGVTWSAIGSVDDWVGVSMSSDGKKLAAAVMGRGVHLFEFS